MKNFIYQEIFPEKTDNTEYRFLTNNYIAESVFDGQNILKIAPDGLTLLVEQAFTDVAHLYRSSHLKKLAKIISDNQASSNDKYVALEMLKNAVISSEFIFPMCQDTGTAIIMGKKGQKIWTGVNDEQAISKGVYNAYTKNNFRYSQLAPISMFKEKNTGCNLPAQIDIYADNTDSYRFLFIAKGGGSANKTFLYQETKAVLSKNVLINFLKEKMQSLGTAACPPYHLAFVIGGTSSEMNLKTVKLASTGYLDNLPITGSETGHAFRDPAIENELLEISENLGIGAQFGGKYFCHDIRVIRLPRHGASCPIGVGVSCSADRNIKGKITRDGIFLEKLETNPLKYMPLKHMPEYTPSEKKQTDLKSKTVSINLDVSMDEIRKKLSKYKVSTRLLLNGKIVVARDIAHAKIKTSLDNGQMLPSFIKNHIIYYAGPAKTPKGYPSGSFGPTTAGRMDPYVPIFQKHGGSLIMLAKGNRSLSVTKSCKKYGGFYLGSIGGPAARLGKECITKVETIKYPELGMEAVFMITVKDFPAFIIVDDKGNDFFTPLL